MEEQKQVYRPVWAMLHDASKRYSGHMPGHKGISPYGASDLYALDTTEIPETDDLYEAQGALKMAMDAYAAAAGAAKTLFLHNGSTVGIHVMLQLWAMEGDTVILPRNAHLSAVNACVLGGMRVVWLPVACTEDGYCYVRTEQALSTLAAHPEAKAMLLVRPDYYGGAMRDADFRRVAEKAHAQGTKIVVDEAHGALFPWQKEMTSAGALGADAWVQSVHKTLPGLTGSAVLHLGHAQDENRAWMLLRREQTSSPSFLLMMSIDDSRAWMQECGQARMETIVSAVEQVRMALRETPYRDAHAIWQTLPVAFDPMRLVLWAPQGGHALQQQLRAKGYDVEMADDQRVVMLFSPLSRVKEILMLPELLQGLPVESRIFPATEALLPIPQSVMTPRQAAMAEEKLVPLACAEGCVSAVAAGIYPPGIPLVCPGEKITADIIKRLQAAGAQERFGVEGDCLRCVNV